MNSLAEHPSASRNDVELLTRCREHVRANGRRWKMVILLEALGLAVAAPLAYLWFVFFLDNQFHLPRAGRLLASLGMLAGVCAAALHIVRRWRSLHLTDDQVALAIERGTPGGVENRLINALQLARADMASHRALNDAVVAENCERLEQMHLEQAAQMRPAAVRLGLAVALVGIGIGFWLVSPELFSNAATRIFLPLAHIDPLYRTTLTVAPGDMEASGDIAIQITIRGERPKQLIVFKNEAGKRSSEKIPIADDDGPVAYIFRDVAQSLDYAVRGGDFITEYYHIEVPKKASLTRARILYQYPAYTGLAEKTVESPSGDLEALYGTRVTATFFFNQPVDNGALILERPASLKKPGETQPLIRVAAKEYTGEILLENLLSYRVETGQGDRPRERSTSFAVRVLKDQEPKLELTGIEHRTEVQIDSVLQLQIIASDDFGLDTVGLFYRHISPPPAGGEGPGVRGPRTDDGWQPIAVWPTQKKTAFRQSHDLAVAALQVAEGEKLELALRAIDTDPMRKGAWTTGAVYELTVGGDGVALQILYEQIVQAEKDLKKLLGTQRDLLAQTVTWIRKLDGGNDIRWDDAKNIETLHAAVKDLGKQQDGMRRSTGQLARSMLPRAGNLRFALGLLADAEMDRLLRMFDSVPSRDQPQAKRAALADARLTQERILRSLEELLEQFQSFRADWELNNMIPFTKMLSKRQTKLRDQSRIFSPLHPGGEGPGVRGRGAQNFTRRSMARRQEKILDLCTLIHPAFTNLSVRLDEPEPGLAKAFRSGAQMLASDSLRKPMIQAAENAGAGRWNEAAKQQTRAAEQLTALYESLRKAQLEAAQKALAALKDKLKSDLEAQKKLEKLPPGTADAFLKEFPENLKLEDLMRIREVAGAKKRKDDGVNEEPDLKSIPLVDVDRNRIELKEDSGVRQDPYSLRLGNVPEKTPFLKLPKDQKENSVKPFIQEKFDDLIGKLLDETEELHKNYQTLKLSTNQNNNDPGEIGKVGGTLNSTGAVAATGNKKPPTMDSGGLSRTGRQGARSHGMVADDEGVNRRGRDKALEGQERVADQAGTIKMKKSDDMQKDTSTGVGGKKVESDDTHFSLHDAGKWKDEFAKRMEKPQKKQYIVERQGDKIDAKTAGLLRDLTSKQEQVIERLKAIKKELRNLYLPTEHLDDLAAALESNLASLKEQPDPEMFRQQVRTLDKLRGAMRVFRNANSGFQPSLPRDRVIQGRVLDEPAALGLPGYEEAVRRYYLKLTQQ